MSHKIPQSNLWMEPGKDIYYEHYRLSTQSQDLREWVNEAIFCDTITLIHYLILIT